MWGSPTTDTVMSDISEYYRSKTQVIPLYKHNVVMVSYNRRGTNAGGNGRRQLRKKRTPLRAVRPPSRVRRGYRSRKRKTSVEIELEREY
jgi:hypothetical protein